MAPTGKFNAPSAGEFNRRVELHDVPSDTQDEYGQPTVGTGTLLGTFWAAVRYLMMRERAAAGQVTVEATHRVQMRWLGTSIPSTAANPNRLILPGMYLVVLRDGTRLDIIEADDVQKAQTYWSLTCRQQTVI